MSEPTDRDREIARTIIESAMHQEQPMTADILTARRLLAPYFATDGEEDGPEAERITTAVEALLGSIAEALSIARAEERERCAKIAEGWNTASLGVAGDLGYSTAAVAIAARIRSGQ